MKSEEKATTPEGPHESPTQAKHSNAKSPRIRPSSFRKGDLDFVADTKAAFLEDRTPYASILLLTIVGIVSAFVFWAQQSSIKEVSKATGKVIPYDKVQLVQSLEGGILAEMIHGTGDHVEKGEPLLRLNDTAAAALYQESLAQRDSLLASTARLDAEATDSERIDFPIYIQEERTDLLLAESQLFSARREKLSAALSNLDHSIRLREKELSITRPLAEQGIVSQVELLRLETALNEAQGERVRIRNDYQNDVLSQRNEARTKLEQLQQIIRSNQDRLARATLFAPIAGTINKLYHYTVGGVVRPGEPIMEIVPSNAPLIVEANVRPKDIAFIHVGQEATVKLTAYDFSIYGGLQGTVEQISADSFTNERGEAFYTVRVRTGSRSLQTDQAELKILPGMQAEVDILTGEKSILQYIFKPLLRAKMNAFTER